MKRKKKEIGDRIGNEGGLENKYVILRNGMIKAVMEATGKEWKIAEDGSVAELKKIRSGIGKRIRNPVSWWDKECEIAIKDRYNALKKVKKEKSLKNWIEYRRLRAVARKVIKKKKREDFQRFAQSLNKNISLKYVWNKMKILKNRDYKQEWNKWREEDREDAIKEQIEKIVLPWVEEDR